MTLNISLKQIKITLQKRGLTLYLKLNNAQELISLNNSLCSFL